MSFLDWLVLGLTISSIIFYGIYKNRKDANIDAYLLGNKSLPWYHICLSTMATQASAITFLSAPGQGFADGMRFVQFYFGLPLAIIVISISFIPIFNKLKVFTAYQYLENRFDSRVRIFTASIFLLSRGLATGLSIYAPSIILSTIFGWDIVITNILMGSLVLIYTVIGGTKAISHTHVQQMFFVLLALVVISFFIINQIPQELGFIDSLKIAGTTGHMKIIDFEFNHKEKYNLWSGLIGGFFLQLSYFGTDQSQVSRYLVGKDDKEAKIGLIANGFLKIPMQFFILLIGVFVFVFYLSNPTPLIFNKLENEKILNGPYKAQFLEIQTRFDSLNFEKKNTSLNLAAAIKKNDKSLISNDTIVLNKILAKEKEIRTEVKVLMVKNDKSADTNDVNYVFLRFLMDHIPHGLIGFIIAIIFTASMGSVASAYNSLAATSLIDIIDKTSFKPQSEAQKLKYSKYLTIFWGLFCIIIANFAQRLGNSLIELVNILGSWFYGIILGIFIVAFYLKHIKAKAIFYSAVISQILIIVIWYKEYIAYLWLNPIGVILIVLFSWIFQQIFDQENVSKKNINS